MATVSYILLFLIKLVFGLYLYILMIRLLLQTLSASWHNPITQVVTKLTTPLLKPVRRFIPGFRGFDIAIIFLALVVAIIQVVLLWLVRYGLFPGVFGLLLFAITELIVKAINIFIFAIIVSSLISWFPRLQGGPLSQIVNILSAPCLKLLRRYIPLIGGFDFSPLVALIVLFLMSSLLVPPLVAWATQLSF